MFFCCLNKTKQNKTKHGILTFGVKWKHHLWYQRKNCRLPSCLCFLHKGYVNLIENLYQHKICTISWLNPIWVWCLLIFADGPKFLPFPIPLEFPIPHFMLQNMLEAGKTFLMSIHVLSKFVRCNIKAWIFVKWNQLPLFKGFSILLKKTSWGSSWGGDKKNI